MPLYSCFSEVNADSASQAVATVPAEFRRAPLAPAKAVRWPPTKAGQGWLNKFVGDPHKPNQ